MTEKKNPNPFIRMAQEAADKKAAAIPVITGKPEKKQAVPKPTQGFVTKVMRKTGRGG